MCCPEERRCPCPQESPHHQCWPADNISEPPCITHGARKHSSTVPSAPCRPGLSYDLPALAPCLSFPTSSGSGATDTAATMPGDIQNHGWYLQRCIPPTLQSKRCLFPSARQGGNSIFICKLEINQNTGVFAPFPQKRPVG